MALNRASDVPEADWLSQTLVKNRNFSLVVTRFFLVVEIPINPYSLYNKVVLSSSSSSLALRCPVGSIAKNASTLRSSLRSFLFLRSSNLIPRAFLHQGEGGLENSGNGWSCDFQTSRKVVCNNRAFY